jgi:hypothetical protein
LNFFLVFGTMHELSIDSSLVFLSRVRHRCNLCGGTLLTAASMARSKRNHPSERKSLCWIVLVGRNCFCFITGWEIENFYVCVGLSAAICLLCQGDNSPNLNRRAILAGATTAALAVPVAAAVPDPIYPAIEAHRRAYAAVKPEWQSLVKIERATPGVARAQAADAQREMDRAWDYPQDRWGWHFGNSPDHGCQRCGVAAVWIEFSDAAGLDLFRTLPVHRHIADSLEGCLTA